MTNIIERTVLIEKRGRVWYEAAMGKYKCKVKINDVSASIEVGHVVKLRANDISVRSKFGTEMKYEPLEILTDRTLEVARAERADREKVAEAEKWLGFAEKDAESDKYRTNAIEKVTGYFYAKELSSDESLTERKNALVKKVAENRVAYEKQRQERWSQNANSNRGYNPLSQDGRRFILVPNDSSYSYVHEGMVTKISHSDTEYVIIEETDKRRFRIDNEMPSYLGSHLLGHEGEWASKVYYRKATQEEVDSAIAKEKVEKEERRRVEEQRAAEAAAAAERKAIIDKAMDMITKPSISERDAVDSIMIRYRREKFARASDVHEFRRIRNAHADYFNLHGYPLDLRGSGADAIPVPVVIAQKIIDRVAA